MRIGIDVRYLSHGLVGGLNFYIRNSVAALLHSASEHQIFLYADTKRPFEITQLPQTATLRLLSYRNPLSSIYNDFFMRQVMARDHLDIVHFPGNYGFGPRNIPSVVTIQDAINLLPLTEIVRGHAKNARTIGMMTYLHFCTQVALSRANLITTVSTFSGEGVARHGRIPPEKIVVVPSACPADIHRVEDEHTLADVRERLGLKSHFILAEAFKNPASVVKAWKILPANLQQNLEIIFFSRSPNVLPIVHEAIAADIARLFVRPARADLSALYSMASAFVFPSWIEGFGLPVLEAMACGAPVIASDRGSIPEVAGDAALLVDAEDAQAIADQVQRVLATPALATSLRERGMKRAAQFSWTRNAELTLDCYRRVLNGHGIGGK